MRSPSLSLPLSLSISLHPFSLCSEMPVLLSLSIVSFKMWHALFSSYIFYNYYFLLLLLLCTSTHNLRCKNRQIRRQFRGASCVILQYTHELHTHTHTHTHIPRGTHAQKKTCRCSSYTCKLHPSPSWAQRSVIFLNAL